MSFLKTKYAKELKKFLYANNFNSLSLLETEFQHKKYPFFRIDFGENFVHVYAFLKKFDNSYINHKIIENNTTIFNIEIKTDKSKIYNLERLSEKKLKIIVEKIKKFITDTLELLNKIENLIKIQFVLLKNNNSKVVFYPVLKVVENNFYISAFLEVEVLPNLKTENIDIIPAKLKIVNKNKIKISEPLKFVISNINDEIINNIKNIKNIFDKNIKILKKQIKEIND